MTDEPKDTEADVEDTAESAGADPAGSSASAERPTDTADETPEPPAKAKAKAKPASTPAPTRRRQPKGDSGTVVRAQAKYVRTSARKARLVCDQIRGKEVEEAYAILAHTPRAVAEAWEKLLKSAVANAENNHELLEDDLRIVAAFADEGPTLKRFRPRAHGRATPIHKRTSHLTIQLNSKA